MGNKEARRRKGSERGCVIGEWEVEEWGNREIIFTYVMIVWGKDPFSRHKLNCKCNRATKFYFKYVNFYIFFPEKP